MNTGPTTQATLKKLLPQRDFLFGQGDPIAHDLNQNGHSDQMGVRLILRSSTHYASDRTIYDCLAVRLTSLPSSGA